MNYLEYVKKYENVDKFILFLLYLGYNPSDVAKVMEVTRQTVYNVVERNKEITKDYQSSIEQLPDAS